MGVIAARFAHKNAGLIAVVVGILAVCMVLASTIFSSNFSSSSAMPGSKAFYSDDDGATTFLDDSTKRPPFQHNGKEAVAAEMFKCGSTKFVGYLERYSPQSLAAMDAARRDRNFEPRMLSAIHPDVKKPGQKNWVHPGSPEGQKILDVKCPDGRNDNIEIVSP